MTMRNRWTALGWAALNLYANMLIAFFCVQELKKETGLGMAVVDFLCCIMWCARAFFEWRKFERETGLA